MNLPDKITQGDIKAASLKFVKDLLSVDLDSVDFSLLVAEDRLDDWDSVRIILFPQEGQKLALGNNSAPQLLQNFMFKMISSIW